MPRKNILINIKIWIPKLFSIHKEIKEDDITEVFWRDKENRNIGVVLFKKAKTNWGSKPILGKGQIMLDADLIGVLNTLHQHINFDEREYSEISKLLESKSREALSDKF